MKPCRRLALLLAVLSAAAESCARSDAATVPASMGRAESIPNGQAPSITLGSAGSGTAAGPLVIAANGTLTRRSPTEQIARVQLTVTNTSASPQLLMATEFTTSPPMIAIETPAQIREATLLPGQSVSGALAWRTDGVIMASTVTLRWAPPGSVALWSVPVKLEEAGPELPVTQVRPGLLEALRANFRATRFEATFASPIAFHGYYGSEWLVRVLATIRNSGRVPITVTRAQFAANEGGAALADLVNGVPPGTTQPYYYRQNYAYCTGGHALAPTTVIQPGQSATAAICWTTGPGSPLPTHPEITVRVPGTAAATQRVAIALGAP